LNRVKRMAIAKKVKHDDLKCLEHKKALIWEKNKAKNDKKALVSVYIIFQKV
jgi:hypothetical protein